MATVQERTGRTLAQPVPTQAARVPQGPPPRQPWRRRALLVVLLTGCSVLFLVPFVWMISASLRPRAYVFDTSLLPVPFAPENYVTVWDRAPVLTWLMNSLLIGVMAALAVTLSSAPGEVRWPPEGPGSAWRDRLLLDLWDRRPSVRARDGALLRAEFLPTGAAAPTSDPASYQLRGDTLHMCAGDQLAAVDLAADRTRWQLRTGVAYRPPDFAGQREPFNASAVGERDGLVLVLARDRCLYVVDGQRGAAVGRHCGLHEPGSGSPLVATAETTVYLTTYGVVAYPLRTG
jgi:hypothetical protein